MKKQSKKFRVVGARAKKATALEGVLVQARISEAAAKRLSRMAKRRGLRGRASLARALLEAAR